MGRLDGREALVSGGARGMGAAIIARFLNEGAKAVVGDVPDAEEEQLVAQLGNNVRFVHLDVTKPADWDQAVREAMSAFASLIRNPGQLGAPRRYPDTNDGRHDIRHGPCSDAQDSDDGHWRSRGPLRKPPGRQSRPSWLIA